MSVRSVSSSKTAPVICEEVFDEDSIATHDEVLEYARRIGIDPERESHLLHIADEGVNQSLPAGWKPCFEEEEGLLYYFNFRSGETRWEHPLDAVYRDKVILARKQLTTGGGAGAEFGRSRRLCAEEEREKKNVSFAPSVHQIEFDLDEEEEDEEEEDEDEEEEEDEDRREEAGVIAEQQRLRQQQPQAASWLREKLEDPGRPGTGRLGLLRAPPDRDDSLEMAQDITEDSQFSLHASEGSDSPRRELERRKEEEVRAALRERRLAEQRRHAQSPSPTPQPPAAPLSGGPRPLAPLSGGPPPLAPLTPARLRPLAPVVAGQPPPASGQPPPAPVQPPPAPAARAGPAGRGQLAPLPGIAGPAPRPPLGGLAPLTPLSRPAGRGSASPVATGRGGAAMARQQDKPAPAAAHKTGKQTPAAAPKTEKPTPAAVKQAEKPPATTAKQSEKPTPAAVRQAEKSTPAVIKQAEKPTPAARIPAPAPADRQTAASNGPGSGPSSGPGPDRGAASGPGSNLSPGPGQPPPTEPRPSAYQGGRGRPVSFTERLLARKAGARPTEGGSDDSTPVTAVKPCSGPKTIEGQQKTRIEATTTATITTVSATTSATSVKAIISTAATTATTAKLTTGSTVTAAATGATLTAELIPFIDEASEGSAGESGRSAAGRPGSGFAGRAAADGATMKVPGRPAVAEFSSSGTEDSSSTTAEESPRPGQQSPGKAPESNVVKSLQQTPGVPGDVQEAHGEGDGIQTHTPHRTNTGTTEVVNSPPPVKPITPGPSRVAKTPNVVPERAAASSADDSHSERPAGAPDQAAGTGGAHKPNLLARDSPPVGGSPDRPAVPGSVLSFSLQAQGSAEQDRERRLRLAAGRSSSDSGSEQDENQIRIDESGELRADRPRLERGERAPSLVRSLYPSESESSESESSPGGGGERERDEASGSVSSPRERRPQPRVSTDLAPVRWSNGGGAERSVSGPATTAVFRGKEGPRQLSAGDEHITSTPTTKKEMPTQHVDNRLENTSVRKSAERVVSSVERHREASPPDDWAPVAADFKRSSEPVVPDIPHPQSVSATSEAKPVHTSIPPAEEQTQPAAERAWVRPDRAGADRGQVITDSRSASPDFRTGTANDGRGTRQNHEPSPAVSFDAPPPTANHKVTSQGREQSPVSDDAPPSTANRKVTSQAREPSPVSEDLPVPTASGRGTRQNREPSPVSLDVPPPTVDRRGTRQNRETDRPAAVMRTVSDTNWRRHGAGSPPEHRQTRSDVCLQWSGQDEPDSPRSPGRHQRRHETHHPTAGRVDQSVGPCGGLRGAPQSWRPDRLDHEEQGGRRGREDAAVQTTPAGTDPVPRGRPRQAWGQTRCDHRHQAGAPHRSALWDTSDGESSDPGRWTPPPRPPVVTEHRRQTRDGREVGSRPGPRPPVTASRSCPQCGRGSPVPVSRPAATVSSPALGGGGGGGPPGQQQQQPASPARLAVRQMRHRIKALGMWSDGDGATSDCDAAPDAGADVRRILERARHFLHGQTGAATGTRRRRVSEQASDSEDESTDEEERSATERDIQLRAVTRHYRRLKQERSHASDSQLNVRPSPGYQPSRGEQLHSSLAAIHTYRPPPPVRRRPPLAPPAPPPPPPPRPRARPERSVLERTQELKAWLRKATVAWKLGSLDV